MRNALAATAAAAAAALAVSGCTGGATPQAAGQSPARSRPAAQSPAAGQPAAAARVHWRSCPAQGARMRCARLQVPLDYRHPGGRKITLALDEVPATARSGRPRAC